MCDGFDGSDLSPTFWFKYGNDWDWPVDGGSWLRVARAVSVAGGVATIAAKPAAMTATGRLESGGFHVRGPYQLTYGRFETRVRVDDDPSRTMSAVVLNWNADERTYPWCDGEADFYETGTDRSSAWSYVHYELSTPNCADAPTFVYCRHGADPRVWHDIVLEWTPSRWQVWNDGRLVCNVTDPKLIPHWKQRTTWQLDAFGTNLTNVVRMQAAYARLYQYAP